MTVRELVAELSGCDPESTVVCDARSEALLVIGARTGMYQAGPETEVLRLSLGDQNFLGTTHIRNP